MAEIKSSRAILAELPEAAVRFAADTWGASWCYNEAGSLVEFASLAHPDTPPPSGDVPKGSGGEIEGLKADVALLLDQAVGHRVCWHEQSEDLGAAAARIVSRITSPSSENTSGRDPSGTGSREPTPDANSGGEAHPDEWQPIWTAPRDGTWIETCRVGAPDPSFCGLLYHGYAEPPETAWWCIYSDRWTPAQRPHDEYRPTHWRPLSAAPHPSQEKGEADA